MPALISLLLLAFLMLPTRAGDGLPDDQKNIQGFWRVAQSIDAGKETPQEGEDITIVIFDGNLIKVREGDKSHDLFQFRLLPDLAPKGIELRHLFGKRKGEQNQGIYQLDGRMLKICIQEDATQKRPTVFESKEGTALKLIVLKKL